MVSHRSVVQPDPAATKCPFDCHVATRNWICNKVSNLIQRNIVDTKPPYKVLDVAHVFLMGLGGYQCLEEPLTIMDLAYLPNLLQSSNALLRDWDIP